MRGWGWCLGGGKVKSSRPIWKAHMPQEHSPLLSHDDTAPCAVPKLVRVALLVQLTLSTFDLEQALYCS